MDTEQMQLTEIECRDILGLDETATMDMTKTAYKNVCI